MSNEIKVPIEVDLTATFNTKKFLLMCAGIAGATFIGVFAGGYALSRVW